jgi:hypothetical protein
MRPALILLVLSPLLVAQSGLPRPRCDFGAGVEALRESARLAALPVPGLLEGRARAEDMATRLRGAVPVFLGCGCLVLAEYTSEAAGLAANLTGATSMATFPAALEQARLRITLAQEQMGRQGCR